MKYSINKSIVLTKHEEELVLLNMKDGNFYGIDETGSYIWGLMEKKASLDLIVKSISTEYIIPEELAYRDTVEFITQLSTYKLVSMK